MGLGKAHRSRAFMDWLRENRDRCQRCGANLHEHDQYMDQSWAQFCHGRKVRPFGGGTSQKASDYSGLMEDAICHAIETNKTGKAWPTTVRGVDHGKTINVKITLPIRDIMVVQNLVEYAEHLDPGIDLWAEMLEYGLDRLEELEEQNEA